MRVDKLVVASNQTISDVCSIDEWTTKDANEFSECHLGWLNLSC